MKILIVDDSEPMRSIIKKTFLDEGWLNLLEANDGVEALEKMDNVDAVVTDWNMPNMDGLELVKKIRSDPKYKGVRIMMISTEGAKEEVVDAIKSGANCYIIKPFTQEELAHKIKILLNG